MTDETLSAREAAERLGVSYSTVKGWLDRLPMGIDRNARGEYLIGKPTLDLLASVRDWRADGSGLDTIARRIGPATAAQPESGSSIAEPSLVHGSAMDEPQPADLLPIVREVSRLALALSEASFRQGQLEEQVRHLDVRATEAAEREQVAIDRANGIQQAANEQAAKANAETERLRHQLADAQARLQAPWWRRLIGS